MPKHTWIYCCHCEYWIVLCGTCGNNCCSGGYGEAEDGSHCPDCPSAYEYQSSGKDMPQVSPEKEILMGLFSYYLKQLPTLWNLDCHTEDGVKHEFSDKHLGWMCLTAVENTPEWPDDKLNRWLGYIQGVMAMKGYIDVQEERDRTREVFHRTYEHRGIPIPETLEDNVSDVRESH